MIRIGFDLSQLAHKGGVASYVRNLSSRLSQMPGLDMVYFYSSLRKPYAEGLKNVKLYKLPPTFFEILFNRWRNVPIERFIGSVDVFHSSDWTQPPSKAKKVTTYHDVVPLKYPQWSHPKIVEVHRRRLKLVEQEVDRVICVSESTKKDLLEISNISEDKIAVIYEGPSADFKRQSAKKVEEFRNKYGLPEKFVLAIGGIGERRNLKRVKEACSGINLVITGQTLPWLSGEELGMLYASTEALIYPSLYEGFGLPILDAQACGCPVVTSNVSAMPEIAGEGAILVDPYSTGDIIRGIREIGLASLRGRSGGIREELIKKGFENLKRFSWKKAADETTEVYRRLK